MTSGSSGSSEGWKAALATAFPVTRGEVSLACAGVVDGPEGPRASMRLTVKEHGEVVWEVEQELELDGFPPREIAAWGERARERLAGLEGAEACTTPAALVVPPFRPLDAAKFYVAAAEPRAIVEALREQALAGGFEQRFDRLAVWPAIPRTIYFLDLAHAMLGGNGLEVYLAQQCFEDVLGVLEALDTAGCPGLALRLRQGLGLSADEGGAEFLVEVDDEWLEDNRRPLPEGDGRAWERIDSHEVNGTWWLVDHELAPALERYVREHLHALVE